MSSGNQAEESRVRITVAIPTVQLFLDSSEMFSGGALEADIGRSHGADQEDSLSLSEPQEEDMS